MSVYFGNTPSRTTGCRCVVEHCAGDEDAAFADQLTLRHSRRSNVKSNFHNNYSRIFHSPVSAQGRLIAQIKIISRTSTCALWEEQRLSSQDKEPKLRLSLETRVAEDVTVISCKGRIAYGAEAAALSGEFAEFAPQTRRVVIDLSGVEMIDAAGPRSTHLCCLSCAGQPVLGQAGCSRQSDPRIAGAYKLTSFSKFIPPRTPPPSHPVDKQHDRPDSRRESNVRFISMRLQFSYALGVPLGQRIKQVPNGKQCQTENSTPEIEVVTDAMFRAPMHPRKQMKCFAEMREDYHYQTSSAEWL